MQTFGSSIGTQSCISIGNKYYKIDKVGYESIAEVLCDELLNCIKGISHVHYYLEKVKVRGILQDACWCGNMLSSEKECLVSAYDLLDKDDGYFWYKFNECSCKERLSLVISELAHITGITKKELKLYFSNIIRFDYLVRNEDRHFNNISFIYSEGKFSLAPIYDNGLSLLSDCSKYPLENSRVSEMINLTKARPFSSSFKEQVDLFRDMPLLQIDTTRLYSRLNQAVKERESCIPFKQEEFTRALRVLHTMLYRTKGKVWEEWVE